MSTRPTLMTDPGIQPEQAVVLSDHIWRITAGNPGLMTGPGTNSYLLLGPDGVALVDPGPQDETHHAALLAAVAASGRPCRGILLTHTHRDHSPGAPALAAALNVPIMGCPPLADDPSQDRDTVIDVVWRGGEVWSALGWPLAVVATPGHVENHLCFFHADAGWLITGDHLIEGSTVVIIPPHGRLGDYLRSLELLLTLPLQEILPGHGRVMVAGPDAVHATLVHRRRREDKLLACFPMQEPWQLADLIPRVYDDVPVALHPVARYSLWAHLIKLAEEGRVQAQQEHWIRLS